MDVQGPVIVTYVYQLVEGEVSRTVDVSFTVQPHPHPRIPQCGGRAYLDRYHVPHISDQYTKQC